MAILKYSNSNQPCLNNACFFFWGGGGKRVIDAETMLFYNGLLADFASCSLSGNRFLSLDTNAGKQRFCFSCSDEDYWPFLQINSTHCLRLKSPQKRFLFLSLILVSTFSQWQPHQVSNPSPANPWTWSIFAPFYTAKFVSALKKPIRFSSVECWCFDPHDGAYNVPKITLIFAYKTEPVPWRECGCHSKFSTLACIYVSSPKACAPSVTCMTFMLKFILLLLQWSSKLT